MRLSIVVPVLDEAEGIAAHLSALAPLRANGAEVIVVDGGSTDATCELAEPLADRVVVAPRGRATQMNAGAALASGDVLVFLHADTRLPAQADRLIAAALTAARRWGRFDVAIEGRHPLLPLVAGLMNLRSRATGIATGDQAIFVTREAFREVRGYPDIPLMEDIALSCALKRRSRPACIAQRVTTSGRRWERRGVVRTIATMWRLRLAFFLGASPRRLALDYGYRPRDA
ncbi:MAG TPA: TIGR04283 family arsenosugar biosynthesis glycosyltransferase [Beijerinckiaceae bacterium]|nr:TIGR04283 family arsenosugar biosynthesis glycosyltransferase [Beijerinckiaceae bacterium]